MKPKNINVDSFNRYFHLASKHFYRMTKASQKIKSIFICSDDDFDDQVDIMTSRFQSLQSVLSEKLIPTALDLLGEQGSNMPFIDVVDKAIKLGIVNIEFDEWDAIRKERNKISHGDYDELTTDEQKAVIKHFQNDEVKSISDAFLRVANYIINNNHLSPYISHENKSYFFQISSEHMEHINAHQKQ